MTTADVTTVDFGEIEPLELEILAHVRNCLRPSEYRGGGITVGLEGGRRTWRLREGGLSCCITADSAVGHARSVVPSVMLYEALHIARVNKGARLTVRDGIVSFGRYPHVVSVPEGVGPIEPVPTPTFRTTATVARMDMVWALTTATRMPAQSHDRPCKPIESIVQLGVGVRDFWAVMDRTAAGYSETRSSIPATVEGPRWNGAVGLDELTRIVDMLHALDDGCPPEQGGDWRIEVGDEADSAIRLSCGDIEFVLDRVPAGMEMALPDIARVCSDLVTIPPVIVDRTTLQLHYDDEDVTCEVFEGWDHRARFTVPVVHEIPDEGPVHHAILREINAHNESHLGGQGVLDEGTLYAQFVLPLAPATVPFAVEVVEHLVRDAKVLRQSVSLAMMAVTDA